MHAKEHEEKKRKRRKETNKAHTFKQKALIQKERFMIQRSTKNI
jgi:hypothetical protein